MRDVSICCHINEVVNNVGTAGRLCLYQLLNNLITVTVKGCLQKTEKELKFLLMNQVCYIVGPEEDRSSPLSPVFHEFMKAFTIHTHHGKNQNILPESLNIHGVANHWTSTRLQLVKNYLWKENRQTICNQEVFLKVPRTHGIELEG